MKKKNQPEEQFIAINSLLKLFVEASSRKEYLDAVIELICKWSGCRCAGIRVLNEHGEIPYESYNGFSKEFWEAENWLSVKRDQCACIRVVLGKLKPQDASMKTQLGSFHCGDTIEFINQLPEKERARFRWKCAESGFLSVSIVPIFYRNQILGAIHLADKSEEKVPLKTVEFLESISPLIGEAVRRFSLEDALRKSHDELEIIVEERTADLAKANDDLRIEIAERKKIEEEVRREKEFSESLVNSSIDGILAFDRDLYLTIWNPAMERLSGFNKEKVIGKNGFELFPFLKEIGEDKYIFETLKGKRIIGRERQFKIPETGRYGWFETCYSPLHNKSGEVIGGLAIIRDITEHKKVEKEIRKLNEKLKYRTVELEAANKELECFSSAVSHDLQAPLIAIDGYIQLFMQRYGDKLDAEGKDCVEHISVATKRMIQLIEDMLKLSRVTYAEIEREEVNLSELAENIVKELQKIQPERQAEVVIAQGLVANCDIRLISIALKNLLGNAWKFTGKKEMARIEFGTTKHYGKSVYFVRDNGVGFDTADNEKLFTPFQRLHSMSEFSGNGIGLATVQRIIHRHGGRVWGEGEEGKGATFYFTV